MADHHSIPLGAGLEAEIRFTEAPDGDFRVLDPTPGLEDRRRAIVDRPWSWLEQVHGATVLEVTEPGEHAGCRGDGLVTTTPGCPLAVTTADCAPLVLLAERGIAVVHAGWRGLLDAIIDNACCRLRSVAGPPVATLLGPCIGPSAYRFGRDDLARLVAAFGPAVEGRTEAGEPALDVPAAVAAACELGGWPAPDRPACTSDERYFSHRTRADQGRQTAVAWLGRAGG